MSRAKYHPFIHSWSARKDQLRGQVGTVVKTFDDATATVAFRNNMTLDFPYEALLPYNPMATTTTTTAVTMVPAVQPVGVVKAVGAVPVVGAVQTVGAVPAVAVPTTSVTTTPVTPMPAADYNVPMATAVPAYDDKANVRM